MSEGLDRRFMAAIRLGAGATGTTWLDPGDGGDTFRALSPLALFTVEASPRFLRVERRRFGTDMMSRYERVD